ncbi:AMP-binding protein [Nocardia sp. alder85J]|uniref:AMP-binding protein n=1 Tax=Nocardia sp. alder85J TaxID=2862949 RepID=UPI001CD71D66|nr:AMP-binding protein [Nocardia sp. alder85J]MCX4094456.1 AMP-binding protein [Nocardia sp. alder85J]
MWGTLPDVLDRACTYYSDSTAIIDGDRSLTYRELLDRRDRVADGLIGLGLRKGERVGLLLPNCLEFIPAQHGIWAAGGVLVQLPVRSSADGFHTNLSQTGATTLIYHAQFEDRIAAIRDRLPELRTLIRLGSGSNAVDALDYSEVFEDGPPVARPDVGLVEDDEAYVLFTSGSTGEPKGVVNSHRTWAQYSISAGLEIGDTRFGEVFAHGAPLTHFTQIFVMPTFVRGGVNVMLPGLDVDGLLTSVERYGVTATAVVPTIVYLLLDHPRRGEHDLSSLRTMIYAGSPIAPERLREALDAFGPIFVQTYAGTEQGYVSCLRKNEHRVDSATWIGRLASAGRPMFQVGVRIRDDAGRDLPVGETGEICSRQLGQMLGYLDPSRNHEALRDGWVHTGDIGRLDADGFLYLVDRKKDMIVSGGFNVFPRQVEDVLATHPAVALSAVVGVPHGKWGEAVHAVVVPKADARVTEGELIAHVKSALGGVAAPKTIEFTDSVPVNPAGKVDKKTIRAPYWQGRERQIG